MQTQHSSHRSLIMITKIVHKILGTKPHRDYMRFIYTKKSGYYIPANGIMCGLQAITSLKILQNFIQYHIYLTTTTKKMI
jgi:hypothetical protein